MAASTVASTSPSTTLWATPSKEWVIQPKPKPGRKPKKDSEMGDKEGAEENGKGRKVQNRAAQRAFRERKQSQLAELQARLQLYEQGEIERSVAIQNVAKRLKEENDKLRQENIALHERIAKLEAAQTLHAEDQKQSPSSQVQELPKKRWRDMRPTPTPRSTSPPLKRSRHGEDDTQDLPSDVVPSLTHLPSPASMASTPDSGGHDNPFSGIAYDSTPDYDAKPSAPLHSFSSFGCGFCTDGGLCVCQQIISEEALSSDPPMNLSNSPTDARSTPKFTPSASATSILDNLPEYKPPVPLRRRQYNRPVTPIFQVVEASASPPTCSGDPSNCMACADDPFGKAFCSAIEDAARGCGSCSDCPNKFGCGMGDQCCQVVNKKPIPQAAGPSSPRSATSNTGTSASHDPEAGDKMIPTNDAWRQIKAHPNVEFADLALLADVVASRTACPGPRFVFAQQTASDSNEATSLDGPYTHRHADRSPPPMLVPQEILVECGRRNTRLVHSDGVREALRLLDAKFSQ